MSASAPCSRAMRANAVARCVPEAETPTATGHAAAHLLDHRLHHPAALLVGEAVRLARDAEDGEAVDAGGERGLDQAGEARHVERAVLAERRREDVEDAGPLDHDRSRLEPLTVESASSLAIEPLAIEPLTLPSPQRGEGEF